MSNYHDPNQPLYGAYASEPDQYAIGQLGPLSGSEAFAPTAFLAAEQPLVADAPDPPAEEARSRARQKYRNDHVKHRRTRSGCLTCRLRRVKCDEGRPVCERCGKGNRECTYPEPRTHTKPRARQRKHAAPAPGDGDSSSLDSVAEEDEDDDAEGTLLSPQKSQSPHQTQRPPASPHPQGPSKPKARRKSTKHESPIIQQQSQTTTTDGLTLSYASSGTRSNSFITTATLQDDISWAHLDPRVQHLLEFHRSVNHHHYFFKYDADEFLHVTLIQQALSYVPLLHAICCFAAYHEAISRSDGHIKDFLEHYDKSVTLLLGSLRSGQKHTTATLLTILQLATFEEYLGDWANLLGHHKAAHNILVELYSPADIMDTEKRRKLLMWYSHFDLVASFLSSCAPSLGKEWFHAIHKYNTMQVEQHPTDIDPKIMVLQSKHKVLAMDMAMLFHQLAQKQMNIADFMTEQQQICEAIRRERTDLDPMLTNPEHLRQPFRDAPSPNSIVQPYVPCQLYTGPLWQINFFTMDSLSMEMMHKIQVAKMTRRDLPPEVRQIALDICRIFEVIEHWQGSPPGAILSCHAALAIAALVLANDQKHIMWCRRKFALIESKGYTYPPALRHTMAQLWKLPEIHHWWLPNEEGYPEIVRAIRAWTSERTPSPNVIDGESEVVRDMKTLFSNFSVNDDRGGNDRG